MKFRAGLIKLYTLIVLLMLVAIALPVTYSEFLSEDDTLTLVSDEEVEIEDETKIADELVDDEKPIAEVDDLEEVNTQEEDIDEIFPDDSLETAVEETDEFVSEEVGIIATNIIPFSTLPINTAWDRLQAVMNNVPSGGQAIITLSGPSFTNMNNDQVFQITGNRNITITSATEIPLTITQNAVHAVGAATFSPRRHFEVNGGSTLTLSNITLNRQLT